MNRTAIRYAKAVLSLATDKATADKVNADMKQITTAISENKELDTVLQSPVIRSSDKHNVLKAVFTNTTETTSNLIDTLITNKRIALLGNVATAYNHLYDALKGTQIAQVTTAIPLTKDLEKKVLDKVKALTGKTTEIENTVDQSILGGFVLRIGDLQYDASVANELNRLKQEFTLN